MAAGAGLSEYTALPYGAGHPGLEPGIAGFGDRPLIGPDLPVCRGFI